jgi:hypothetical protein
MNRPVRLIEKHERRVSALRSGQSDRVVLVHVRQLVENSEGMCCRRIIPSVAWLQSVDDCVRLRGHPVQNAISLLSPVLLLAEHREISRASEQLPEMVETGARVVDAIANNDADSQRRLIDWGKRQPDSLRLCIEFCGEGQTVTAHLEVGRDFVVERSQVLFGPEEFSSDAL